MNVEFEYRYRDYGNFKNYGRVVFSNRGDLTLPIIQQRIEDSLIDAEFFRSQDLRIPELSFREFPFDPDLDHTFHEFCAVSESNQPATDDLQRDISEFLQQLESLNK